MEEEVKMRIIDTQLPLTCLPIKLISFCRFINSAAPGTFICSGEINKSAGSFQVKDGSLIAALDDHEQLQNDKREIDAAGTWSCMETWKKSWEQFGAAQLYAADSFSCRLS